MMNLYKLRKFDQDPPPIPGACIPRFAKQLTSNNSSKAKDIATINTNGDSCCISSTSRSLSRHAKVLRPQLTQQQHHKKHIRRRLHTGRRYQEMHMSMAEARREIAYALKIHRASKKQASEQQPQPQLHQQQVIQEQKQHHQHHQSESFQLFNHISFEQGGKFNSSRDSLTFPSPCMNNFLNITSIPNSYYDLPLANSTQVAPPFTENPNFTSLPEQAIGLNPNLDNFNNFNDGILNNNNNNSSLLSYSSPTSSSLPLSIVVDQEVPLIGTSQQELGSLMVDNIIESMATSSVDGGLHTTMDHEVIQEIKSLTELYQMELNDTMNMFSSTWWSSFFNNMDHGGAPEVVKNESDACYNLDELTEFPSSLNANESYVEPSSLNANESCLEQCLDDYFKDPTLSCMDIGDIEFQDYDEKDLFFML